MKVLIIEDEKYASNKLETTLLEIDPLICILAKIRSIKESVKWLTNNSADLIFMDIQLADGICFSIFEQIQVSTPIIFTTAYDMYSIEAFKVNSISYLLKPIRKEDLIKSLAKYRQIEDFFSSKKNLENKITIDYSKLANDYKNLITKLQDSISDISNNKKEPKTRFIIQIGKTIKRIDTKDIAYFYIMDRSCFIRTFDGSNHLIDHSLEKLIQEIDNAIFFRINRRCIVNINAISKMTAYSRSRIKLELNPPIHNIEDSIVSIDRSADFKKWL